MKGITKKMLDKRIDYLNKITNSPMETYTKDKAGKFKANIRNYHLSGAYGGWTLHRINNEGGGVITPLNCGYVSKREMFNLLNAFIDGIDITLHENGME